MKLVRLALGILIIIQGVQAKEWMFILLGVFFTLLPILNLGCCASNACSTPAPKKGMETEDVTYEEVK